MPENDIDKITESDVKSWIHKSYMWLYIFDRPNVYIHRYKKIGCYKRFFINFNVRTGKLLVYTMNEKELKKKILFVTKSKAEMLNKKLYELFDKATGKRNSV